MPGRHPAPLGLLGTLAIIAAIECGLSHRDRFNTDDAINWGQKGKLARKARGSVLCFGDSLVEFGVQPNVIDARLGGRSYNFALPGGAPAASYYLLKRCLDSGARPRAVVVDFPPWQLIPVPHLEQARKRLWPELLGLSEVLDLSCVRRDPDLATTILVSELLASYRERFELRAAILASVQSRENHRRDNDIRVFLTRWNMRVNRGALALPFEGRKADRFAGLPDIRQCPRDPEFVIFVDRFFSLAASHSVPVYWLATPFSPEHQADCDAVGGTAAYDEFVREERARHRGLIFVDARHSGYDPSAFNDAMHLNKRGATALSDDLAGLIADGPGPGSWVSLPPYRERPASPLVEDILESRVAVKLDPPGMRR